MQRSCASPHLVHYRHFSPSAVPRRRRRKPPSTTANARRRTQQQRPMIHESSNMLRWSIVNNPGRWDPLGPRQVRPNHLQRRVQNFWTVRLKCGLRPYRCWARCPRPGLPQYRLERHPWEAKDRNASMLPALHLPAATSWSAPTSSCPRVGDRRPLPSLAAASPPTETKEGP